MARIHLAALTLGTVIIAGCASAPSGPQIVAGNEESVIVHWLYAGFWAPHVYFDQTFAVAEVHCAKYGRKAKYVGDAGKGRPFDAVYDCVK